MTSGELTRLRSYDEFTGRLWHDKRASPLVRELLLACAYILEHDPTVNDPTARPKERGGALWKGIRELMGVNDRGRARYKDAVAADAPRYEPPNTWPRAACEAPRIRVREPQAADPLRVPAPPAPRRLPTDEAHRPSRHRPELEAGPGRRGLRR
jgi:hypothetical protein